MNKEQQPEPLEFFIWTVRDGGDRGCDYAERDPSVEIYQFRPSRSKICDPFRPSLFVDVEVKFTDGLCFFILRNPSYKFIWRVKIKATQRHDISISNIVGVKSSEGS